MGSDYNVEALTLRTKISEFEATVKSYKIRLREIEEGCYHRFSSVVIGKNHIWKCAKNECQICGLVRYENI